MEQLALLVLNGEGSQLIGRKTTQTDIQAFIDNVPNYMVKIPLIDPALNIFISYVSDDEFSKLSRVRSSECMWPPVKEVFVICKQL